MQVSLESTSNIERRMTIGVPAEEVEQQVDERLREAAKQVRLNGFRPGKVPMKVVRKRFGQGVRQEVLGEVMRNAWMEAIQEQDVQPASQPRFEPQTVEEGKDFEFVAVFEVMPEIQVGDLSQISVEKPWSEVQDKDINKMIDNLRRQQATYKEVKRKAKKKDVMTIDFTGTIDGEEFEGGSGEDQQLTLGDGQMIAGFEDQLVGAKTGEEHTLDVTFPEDYQNEELAGKQAQFQVTVKKVEEPQLPTLDKEFFEQFGVEAETEEEFREEVRKNMERELKNGIQNRIKQQVIDGLLEVTELEVPQGMVDQEIERMKQEAVQQFGGQMDPSQLPSELFQDQAQRRIKTGLLFQQLVQDANLEVDSERVDEKIREIASTYQDPDEVVEYYNNNQEEKQQIESSVLEDQVVDHVLENAKVKQKKYKYEDAVKPPQQGA
ncbi:MULTISPECIES: trigger factor [Gammaproteobacteria]|mgnify:FL=1|jgi:trigger factor|uniref:Trigger factor n=1 Tax=Vreelandella halophila TaxID=86177 RepID=A0A9X4YBY9_9GAMM|nr:MULTISPECIES: trigger factor [Gammaproteobacteria]KAA8984362.1 trigger factor [Halospina sp. K52047b]MYL26914.1 trigger factor [Halomonas utahensis]MYL74175.1 trigger factor [Halomonas sp. 22501_18_FS]